MPLRCLRSIVLILLLSNLHAEPFFLELSLADSKNHALPVFPGKSAELILTVTAASPLELEAKAELGLVGGSLVAPIFSDRKLTLTRIGQAKPGVQRFTVRVDMPETGRPGNYLLRIMARSPGQEWLPLPAVLLEAAPSTWKNTLKQLVVENHGCKIDGSPALDRVFLLANIPAANGAEPSPDDAPKPRIVFYDATGNDDRPAPGALLVEFRRDVRGGISLQRPVDGKDLSMWVDARALEAERDPGGAELLQRALDMASALLPPLPK